MVLPRTHLSSCEGGVYQQLHSFGLAPIIVAAQSAALCGTCIASAEHETSNDSAPPLKCMHCLCGSWGL